jgi:hypothetical protein
LPTIKKRIGIILSENIFIAEAIIISTTQEIMDPKGIAFARSELP